jgi:N utilization substance protein B
VALRVLYELEMNPRSVHEILAEAFAVVPRATREGTELLTLAEEDDEDYWAFLEYGFTDALETYCQELVEGVRRHQPQIDELIRAHLVAYELDRLSAVDRVILRIAAYELLHVPYISPSITINEAIEIAKQFSNAESGKFVNGVLGNLYRHTPKGNWDPAWAEAEPEVYVSRLKAVEPAEEIVSEDSEEGKRARRYGWVLKSELAPE